MSAWDTYSELELKLVRLDMETMLLDELKVLKFLRFLKFLKFLKVLKILKQAHIELIRSNFFEAERYYPLWAWLSGMSWMWYFDPDHLFFLIVAKLGYLLLLEWLEWLKVAHVINLPWCIRLLIAVPKISRLRHSCILASLHLQ
jgi:hypothetical protein